MAKPVLHQRLRRKVIQTTQAQLANLQAKVVATHLNASNVLRQPSLPHFLSMNSLWRST